MELKEILPLLHRVGSGRGRRRCMTQGIKSQVSSAGQSLPADSGTVGEPFAQSVREILSEDVTMQINHTPPEGGISFE
jgi:hypothetical protein